MCMYSVNKELQTNKRYVLVYVMCVCDISFDTNKLLNKISI